MKRPKLLMKVDHNGRGKVYVGKKWQEDVVRVDIHGEPWNYEIELEKYKRDSSGRLVVENSELQTYTEEYRVR